VIGTVRRFAQGALTVGVLASASLVAQPALAHIDLDEAGTHMSRSGGGFTSIKTAPCGLPGSTRNEANVYTYKPGSTITIKLGEYIPHPGYFRISFDDDGDDDFVNPASVTGESGDCNGDPLCGPGMEDYCSNDTVLLDNLNRHVTTEEPYSWTVTLPNVECDNCTLQVIQVMEDFNLHPQDYPADDIYYQCIELVLSNEATNESDTPMPIDGVDCKADAPMGGAGGTGGSGGMSATGGMGGMMASGGAGGMSATGGAGGMSATGGAGGAGGGGAGGTFGTAGDMAVPTGGSAGAAGAMAAGGAGGGVGGTGAPSAASSDDGGGCSVSSAQAASALWPLGLALLFLRRRRA